MGFSGGGSVLFIQPLSKCGFVRGLDSYPPPGLSDFRLHGRGDHTTGAVKKLLDESRDATAADERRVKKKKPNSCSGANGYQASDSEVMALSVRSWLSGCACLSCRPSTSRPHRTQPTKNQPSLPNLLARGSSTCPPFWTSPEEE